MSFHEVRFPTALSFGSIGGPERRTEVVTLANGFEERNSPWAHSRRRYDAGFGLRSMDDVEELIAFFEARQGQMHGFRWKDWADFRSCQASGDVTAFDQLIAQGDQVTTAYQLVKCYESGPDAYHRPVCKPVPGSVRVAVGGTELQEGVDWSIDTSNGLITFAAAPATGAEIRAGFELDVPVRFDVDRIQVSVASFRAGEVPSVPVVEVRV